jgi:hypothetical protein
MEYKNPEDRTLETVNCRLSWYGSADVMDVQLELTKNTLHLSQNEDVVVEDETSNIEEEISAVLKELSNLRIKLKSIVKTFREESIVDEETQTSTHEEEPTTNQEEAPKVETQRPPPTFASLQRLLVLRDDTKKVLKDIKESVGSVVDTEAEYAAERKYSPLLVRGWNCY